MKKLTLAAIIAATISCSTPKQTFQPIRTKNRISQEQIDKLKAKAKKMNFSTEKLQLNKKILESEESLKYQKCVDLQDFEKAKELIKKDQEQDKSGSEKNFFDNKLSEVNELEKKRNEMFSKILKSKKTFKKEYKKQIKKMDKEKIKQTNILTYSALKYAKNKEPSKIKLTYEYNNKLKAHIMDMEYNENLAKIIRKGKNKFEKRLEEMIEKENKNFEEIFEFVNQSEQYAKLTESPIPKIFFEQIKKQLKTYNIKKEKTEKENKSTKLEVIKIDTTNTQGIYTYKGKIIVITNFKLNSYDLKVNKGMLINEADKQLYLMMLKANKIKRNHDLKIKGGDVIPFNLENKLVNYKHLHKDYEKDYAIVQGRVIYTKVGSRSQTKKLIEKYLKPIILDSLSTIIFDKIYKK